LKLADGAAADGETFHARDEKNKMGIVDLITAKAVHVPGGVATTQVIVQGLNETGRIRRIRSNPQRS